MRKFKKKLNRYRVWGEYGPTAHDYVVFYCNAYSYENATKRAVKHFKKLPHWPMIGGLHNVYCQLANTKE